jgi:hypothetical protein
LIQFRFCVARFLVCWGRDEAAMHQSAHGFEVSALGGTLMLKDSARLVFHREVFDMDPTSTLPEIPFWEPVERGQGGNWSSGSRFEWAWRDWLASLLGPILENILQGGHVLEIGCGPMLGLIDPCPGMSGPLWDFGGSSVTCVGG